MHTKHEQRQRPAGGPCPECGRRVTDRALLCGWCYTWRPRRGRVRYRAEAPVQRTGRERRTGVRTVAILLTLGAATVAAQAARAVRLAAAAATAREGPVSGPDSLAPVTPETGGGPARTG